MSSFAFLERECPEVYKLARDAEERYRQGDAPGCVTALRALGERIVALLMRAYGIQDIRDTQAQRIDDLYSRRRIQDATYLALHVIRDIGNTAAHTWHVSQADAYECLNRAYTICVLERGVLAPRCKVVISSYSAPEFGEAARDLESLRLENAELQAQLIEISGLIESDGDGGDHPEANAEPVAWPATGVLALMVSREDIVRIWRIRQLRDLWRRYKIAKARGRSTSHYKAASDAHVWETPSALWLQFTRLQEEVEQSFIAERDFADLLARKHKAALIRRNLEAEGKEWPATWDAELERIEQQIASLNIERWRFDPNNVGKSEEEICWQILECMRRQAIAEALRQTYNDYSLKWRPELSRAQRELRLALRRLWEIEPETAPERPRVLANRG